MYNSNTDSLGLILDVEVFFLWVTVQEHCELDWIDTKNLDSPFLVPILFNDTMDLRHEEVLIKFFTTFLQI